MALKWDCHGKRMFFPTSLCGVLVFGSASRPPPRSRPAPVASSHTTCSHTTYLQTQLTHTQLAYTHTTCQHTTYSHTTCTHTHNLLTHNLLTHNLHTHTQLTHTQLAHFLRGRRGTWRHVAALCVAGVGRRGTLRHPPSFHVAGVARMALGWLWWRARFPHVAVDAAAFCVASVALGDM